MEVNFNLPLERKGEIQKAIEEHQLKATINAIKDFFDGYDSAFKKKVKEQLESQEMGVIDTMTLPKIIGLINEALEKQIKTIANECVAQTFLPMINQILTRTKSVMKFSEFLEEIIEMFSIENEDEVSLYVNESEKNKWLDCKLKVKDVIECQFTLHQETEWESGKGFLPTGLYKPLSMPFDDSRNKAKLRVISKEDEKKIVELELPFMPNILDNPLMSLMARIIISQTKFEMDVEDFTEEMFHKECHC